MRILDAGVFLDAIIGNSMLMVLAIRERLMEMILEEGGLAVPEKSEVVT